MLLYFKHARRPARDASVPWRAVGLPDAAVTAISAGIVVVDIFPLRMPTSDSHGRLTPEKTY